MGNICSRRDDKLGLGFGGKMTDCCGLMGKIFGHCFKEYTISKTVKFEGCTFYSNKRGIIFPPLENGKEIRCKRCGKHV